jgi:selenocysteine lyase/cysteine desulfurase
LRDMLPLTRKYIQLSTFLLASHSKPILDAIEKHRRALDENPAQVSVADVQKRLRAAINSETRVVAATWLHSSNGVKLPIKAMSDTITRLNKERKANKQLLFCIDGIDGIDGFGVENQDVSELGYDFFVAGTHQ